MKIGNPLYNSRLVTDLSLAAESEIVDIREPGSDPVDHFVLDSYILSIGRFFWDKGQQFATADLFQRQSTVDNKFAKQFIIDIEYNERGETNILTLKRCFVRLTSFSASDTPAGLTDESIEFRVLNFE